MSGKGLPLFQLVYFRALSRQLPCLVGDQKSSNAKRLVEVAKQAGRKAFLIETEADLAGLDLTEPVGLTAASSASEDVVMAVFRQLTK